MFSQPGHYQYRCPQTEIIMSEMTQIMYEHYHEQNSSLFHPQDCDILSRWAGNLWSLCRISPWSLQRLTFSNCSDILWVCSLPPYISFEIIWKTISDTLCHFYGRKMKTFGSVRVYYSFAQFCGRYRRTHKTIICPEFAI